MPHYTGSKVVESAIPRQKFWSLFLGLTSIIQLPGNLAPGVLYLGEVFFLLLIFYYLAIKDFKLSAVPREIRLLIKLIILWMVGILITDIIRQVDFILTIKSLALAFFTATNLLGLWFFCRQSLNKLSYFILGRIVSIFLLAFFNPTPNQVQDPWKFAFGGILVSLLCLLPVFFSKSRYFFGIITAIAGILLFAHGSRSLGVITFFVSVSVLLGSKSESNVKRTSKIFRNMSSLLVSLSITSTVLFIANQFTSPEVQSKNQIQSTGEAGILIGGRPEIIFSLTSIQKNPILGIGSYSKGELDTIEIGVETLRSLGYTMNYQLLVKNGQPIHSYLFGNWVQIGLLGAFFWMYCLKLLGSSLFNHSYLSLNHGFLWMYYGSSFLWAIFFSPFGSVTRMETAITIVFMMMLRYGLNNKNTDLVRI